MKRRKKTGKEGRNCSRRIVLTKGLDCQERKDGIERNQKGLSIWEQGRTGGLYVDLKNLVIASAETGIGV